MVQISAKILLDITSLLLQTLQFVVRIKIGGGIGMRNLVDRKNVIFFGS